MEMREAKCYSTQILSKQGEVLIENAQVQARWKEYVEELYNKNNKPRANDFPIELEGDMDKRGLAFSLKNLKRPDQS